MANKDTVLALIYAEVAEFNAQLGAGQSLGQTPDTVLVGQDGALDSLGLLNFLSNLEERLTQGLGRRIQLMDEAMMTDDHGPLRTFGTLATYVVGRL